MVALDNTFLSPLPASLAWFLRISIIRSSMWCPQSREQRLSTFNVALYPERVTRLISAILPIRHFMHRHSELDTKVILERPLPIDPSYAYHPNTFRPSHEDAGAGPLPIHPSTTSMTLSPATATMPLLSRGDNGTLFPLSSPETRMFPITASDFQRYERNVTQYVCHHRGIHDNLIR